MAFGEVLFDEHAVSPKQPYLFNGKELDYETGLYYYGARYYDPKTSLWLNTDPLSGYNPIQEVEHYIDGQHNGGVFNFGNLNTYTYTYQNPIKYVDPNGKQVIPPILQPLVRPTMILGKADVISTMETMTKVGETTIKVSRTAETIAKQQENFKIGRHVEKQQLEKIGLEKNNRVFEFKDPKTGKLERTIPDAIKKDGGTVEIKHVQKQSLTKQLREQQEISKNNGAEATLYINRGAKLSRPLENSGIKIHRFTLDLKIDNVRVNNKLPAVLPSILKE